MMILVLAVWMPVIMWRKLGDDDFVSDLSPSGKRLMGVKTAKGSNGKTYFEPPPPLKRLRLCLIFGLLWASFCGSLLWVVSQFIHFAPQ
jgi:hypothetical protein